MIHDEIVWDVQGGTLVPGSTCQSLPVIIREKKFVITRLCITGSQRWDPDLVGSRHVCQIKASLC
jgi:hypothetical protein